jgi:hypothetical protein
MNDEEAPQMATTETDASGAGRLPTWITIGSMKSATTSLHRYLAEHPDIDASEPKELDFFIEPRYGKLGIDWYRRQFAGSGIACGESSVNYTKCHKHAGVAARVHHHLPDVRLVYMVRDPFDRIESHWVHAVGEGKLRGDLTEALRDLERSSLVQTSRYWTQLSCFLEFYDPAQIRVVSYEQFSDDPHRVLRDVLSFLGVDPDFEHPMVGRRIHDSGLKRRPPRWAVPIWGDPVKHPRYRRRIRRLIGRPIEPPEWTTQDRARVREYLQPEVDAIREFSGLELGEWSM